jgi:biopolymer transport protein ExbD
LIHQTIKQGLENMKYFTKLMKMVSIRVFSFSLMFIFSLAVFSFLKVLNEEPKAYIINAQVFARDKLTPKCPDLSRPNPLFLMVSLDKNNNIKLNKDEMENLENTSKLEKILSNIFEQRTRDEVRNDENLQIETTVVIRPDNSVKYGNIVKLIEVLNRAGADPVVLDPSEEICRGGGSGPCGGKNETIQHEVRKSR